MTARTRRQATTSCVTKGIYGRQNSKVRLVQGGSEVKQNNNNGPSPKPSPFLLLPVELQCLVFQHLLVMPAEIATSRPKVQQFFQEEVVPYLQVSKEFSTSAIGAFHRWNGFDRIFNLLFRFEQHRHIGRPETDMLFKKYLRHYIQTFGDYGHLALESFYGENSLIARLSPLAKPQLKLPPVKVRAYINDLTLAINVSEPVPSLEQWTTGAVYTWNHIRKLDPTYMGSPTRGFDHLEKLTLDLYVFGYMRPMTEEEKADAHQRAKDIVDSNAYVILPVDTLDIKLKNSSYGIPELCSLDTIAFYKQVLGTFIRARGPVTGSSEDVVEL